jgi:hypothetical protein
MSIQASEKLVNVQMIAAAICQLWELFYTAGRNGGTATLTENGNLCLRPYKVTPGLEAVPLCASEAEPALAIINAAVGPDFHLDLMPGRQIKLSVGRLETPAAKRAMAKVLGGDMRVQVRCGNADVQKLIVAIGRIAYGEADSLADALQTMR